MRLTDEQWAIVQPLIPDKRRRDRKGRPRTASRIVLEAVLWVLWTGAQWRALPGEYPPYQTCHRRFQEWVREKVFRKVLRALAEDLRDRGKLDLTENFIDGTHAGAKRGATSCYRAGPVMDGGRIRGRLADGAGSDRVIDRIG